MKLIPNSDKQSDWISVDERLPDKYENVLVFCDGVIRIDFICSSGVFYDMEHIKATHWMPLPDPPAVMKKEDVIAFREIKKEKENDQGEWKKSIDEFSDMVVIRCSICSHTGQTYFKYCPNCGAKMKGE